MANCLINKSITKSCDYNIAGIQRMYITNYDRKTTYVINDENYISDITLSDVSGKYFEVDFVDETAYFQDDLTVSNGNRYRTVTIQVVIPQNTVEMLSQVTPLDLGNFTVVLVDKAGKCNLMGRVNGLKATNNNYASGTASGDANGWTVQLTGIEPETHQLLSDEDVVASLI